jgi:hypothetical protein
MNKELLQATLRKEELSKQEGVTCALGTLWRVEARWVENNESLFFLSFGTTPGTPTATENRRGGWACNAAVCCGNCFLLAAGVVFFLTDYIKRKSGHGHFNPRSGNTIYMEMMECGLESSLGSLGDVGWSWNLLRPISWRGASLDW